MSSMFKAGDAAGYEAMMGRWSRRLAPELVDFAGIDPARAVLDAGCGTGSLTGVLAGRRDLSRIAGIDISEAYLALARERFAGPRFELRHGDLCELPYRDGEFDAALSLLVLQFVPDSGKALSELRRVVRRGGIVAAAVWDSFGGAPHTRLMFDIAGALGLDPGRSLFRPLSAPGEMAKAWRAAGFEAVEDGARAIRVEFANFDDYWSPFLAGDGPGGQLVTALAPEARERLRAAIATAFLSGRPDGPRSFVSVAWVCRGRVP
jgi:SAM-dependent methyltransferase